MEELSDLLRDKICVLKKDGTRSDEIKASVQSDQITIMQSQPIIETGDLIVRKMSNGGEETFEVVDPGFYEGLDDVPAGYIARVRKLGLPEAKTAMQSITYNVHGNNARINHHSVDHSTNIVQEQVDVGRLITALRQAIESADLSAVEKIDAFDIIEGVEAHFTSPNPKRSVVKAMLAALPDVATIATTINALASLAG
jgi:hypothetical protein